MRTNCLTASHTSCNDKDSNNYVDNALKRLYLAKITYIEDDLRVNTKKKDLRDFVLSKQSTIVKLKIISN